MWDPRSQLLLLDCQAGKGSLICRSLPKVTLGLSPLRPIKSDPSGGIEGPCLPGHCVLDITSWQKLPGKASCSGGPPQSGAQGKGTASTLPHSSILYLAPTQYRGTRKGWPVFLSLLISYTCISTQIHNSCTHGYPVDMCTHPPLQGCIT